MSKGKSQRPGARSASPSPSRSTSTSTGASRPLPRFWFDFEVPWLKVALVRVTLFGLLAVDAFLQIPHAARSNAGTAGPAGAFNVAHFAFLDGVAPGRSAFVAIHLLETYLFALIALGVAARVVVPVVAAVYSWVYFSSQLDSYQHHYLIALLLVVACFVPWQRPSGAGPIARAPVRSWALRLILVQLGVVYLWTAIAKMDASWLDGSALREQLREDWIRGAIESISGTWSTISVAVLLTELFLAVAVWCRPLWRVALPLGIAFHIGIALSGLDIGLFAYVMLALYLLVIPDEWIRAVVQHLPQPGPPRRMIPAWIATAMAVAAWVLAPLAAVAILPFPEAGVLLYTPVPLVLIAARPWRLRGNPARPEPLRGALAAAAAPVAAVAVLLALHAVTPVAVDHYRLWGGSAKRLGRLDESRAAYARVVEIDPDNGNGHYQLGALAEMTKDDDQALQRFRTAQGLEPHLARAVLGEARVVLRRGDRAAALELARRALTIEPSSPDAKRMVQSLSAAEVPTPAEYEP